MRVDLEGGLYEARKLVITAGPWVGELLPDPRRICRPERQVMLWTEPLNATAFDPARFPVFNIEAPTGRYGFPDDRGDAFKIGKLSQAGRKSPVFTGTFLPAPPRYTPGYSQSYPRCAVGPLTFTVVRPRSRGRSTEGARVERSGSTWSGRCSTAATINGRSDAAHRQEVLKVL